jgi:hypothetical protein
LLRHHQRMTAERLPPLLHDDFLGPLRRYGDHSLIGEISIDPAIRPARHNGETDAEVLLEFGFVDPGPELDAKVSIAAASIRSALTNLAAIKSFGIDHSPSDWREYLEAQDRRPLVERLFLDGFEVDQTLGVSACFDYEDLGTLIVRVDPVGQGLTVELRL